MADQDSKHNKNGGSVSSLSTAPRPARGIGEVENAPPSPTPGHPLAEVAGSFAGSPFWEAVMTEIKARRRPWWRFWRTR
jgi:hypothetical protein